MLFYSECWLSNLHSLVNAPSIWKILINNILFSNPSYTLRFAMLSETMTGKSIHMRTRTQTHTGTSTDISQRPFVCLFYLQWLHKII